MSNKANIGTFDDFIKKYPQMAELDPMNKIDFSLEDINQNDLLVLNKYFSDICTDLTIYMQLFSEEESINQLNEFNSFIFGYIERAYLERICLKVSTLMDPPGKKDNENLSLQRFIKQTDSKILQNIFDELKTFYINSGIKGWRDKVLAHADLKAISGEREIQINFDRKEVDDFVAEIQTFIDLINDPKTSTDHKVVLPREQDGYRFIQKIQEHNKSNHNRSFNADT
jgi:hypothetical protein